MYQPGRYVAKVTKQQLGVAGTGTHQFILSFQILGMVDPMNPTGDLIACDVYERTSFRSITDKTIDWVMRELDALGIQIESWAQLDERNANCFSVHGKEIEVECKHEHDQSGKLRERWNVVLGSGGGFESKPLDPQDARKLDVLFGKHLKSAAKAPRQVQQPQPQAQPQATPQARPHGQPAQRPSPAAAVASNASPFNPSEYDEQQPTDNIPF